MDPCPFVRLIVESLALKLHTTKNTTTKYFAKLKLTNFPSQTTLLPITAEATASPLPDSSETAAASFDLDPEALRGLLSCNSKPSLLTLKLSVYAGKQSKGLGTCVHARGKLLGSVQVCVSLGGGQSKASVYHSGWMKLSGGSGSVVEPVAKLHATVRSEPDPRYLFQFGGELECSPVVFQIQGNNIRQPVFSCNFTADRSNNRSLPSDFSKDNKQSWLRRTFSSHKEHDAITRRERKGWMVTIYDLSGSAVAAASMITPFVPSPNSDFVSQSNPGAWLVLRPSSFGWKPWGRLEAWREKGKKKNDSSMGYKFDLLIHDGKPMIGSVNADGIPIAEGKIGFRKGGEFRIDGSYYSVVRGFVMGTDIGGEGRASGGKEEALKVRVRARYVADAALFMALAAAVDLSMDACRVF